jgi:hypothetical protein
MLKFAFPYKEKLNETWQKSLEENSDKYKFYCNSSFNYNIYVDENSCNRLQYVSINNTDNSIIGYFIAYIDREINIVTSINVLNFNDPNIIFTIDFVRFLTDLFKKYNFNKIEWRCIVGNPAEKLYNFIIQKYGGYIVGIKHQTVKTCDGVIRDEKEYELFRKDYYFHLKNKNIEAVNYKTEKAIQEFYDNAFHESLKPDISDESKAMALRALLEKQGRENNVSLTLEELKAYECTNPVWISILTKDENKLRDEGWAKIYINNTYMEIMWFGDEVTDKPLIKNYGKTFVAYLYKPLLNIRRKINVQ